MQQPEYLKYWGLGKAPFSLTPDPDMLYMSKQHQEGLVRLKYAVISNKGGALLVSEHAGDGKTTLLAKLRRDMEQQYRGGCRLVFIDHPTLTTNQMVAEIARQLGVSIGTTDKMALLNALRQHLLECHRQDIKCVVILDEGQMLCDRLDLLQELRILLNFCVSDSFLLTFILSGQRPLDEALRAIPEFYQRLPVRFFLKNLTREETSQMIRFRLRRAGNQPDRELFSQDGYTGIFNYSMGCPRIICSVADLALVIAHSRYSKQVDFVAVSQACSDMGRTDGGYHYYYFLKSFSDQPDSTVEEQSRPKEGAPAGSSCIECGAGVSEGAKYCPECGKSLMAEALGDKLEEPEERAEDLLQPGDPFAGEIEKEPEALGDKLEEPEETAEDLLQPGDPFAGEIEKEPEAVRSGVREEDTSEADLSEAGECFRDIQQKPPPWEEEQDEPSGKDKPEDEDSNKVKCSFCGLFFNRDKGKCPNCGEPVKEEGEGKDEIDVFEPESGGESGREDALEAGGTEEAAGPDGDSSVGAGEGAGQGASPASSTGEGQLTACPHCHESIPAEGSSLCPVCGSPIDSDSYEQVLLRQFDELSLRKNILSKSYLRDGRASDPRDEELLFIPLGGFLGKSAVLQFSNGGSGDSFVTRCGLIFAGDNLRFVFTDGVQDLPYRDIKDVSIDRLTKKDTVILYRLVLSTAAGCYVISLPFRLPVAREISGLLEQYLSAKIEAFSYVETCLERTSASLASAESKAPGEAESDSDD
ncbi:MAG: AAA family ATPase [Gemmatimonadota bacterium]|nr:AAA family ATPase [Gemmatimonadota bacterium]